jgi:hypothetical protein
MFNNRYAEAVKHDEVADMVAHRRPPDAMSLTVEALCLMLGARPLLFL